MASLQEIKRKVLSLRGREMELAIDAMNENAEAFADLNASQLAQGIKSNGKESYFVYSPTTIAIKKGMSGLAGVTDHLTNYDTGESYQKLYMKAKGSEVVFGTRTDKEDAISGRMDGKAFGLTKENKEEFVRQNMQNSFNRMVREALK